MESHKQPLVSIICITYNHHRYIRDALDGFLMQETDFPFEVIVHDDASDDGTADIIREYEVGYPGKFICIYQKENQFSKGVRGIAARFAFPHARGKYIALCEGDDYWTDSRKLQKQADFLENNPDFSLCFHRVRFSYRFGLFRPSRSNKNQPEETDLTDLCRGNYIYTASCLIRHWLKDQLPEWTKQVLPFDWPFYVLVAQRGKIKFLNETMAVYRIHDKGIWSGNSMVYKWSQEIEMLGKLREYLDRADCFEGIEAAIAERKDAIGKANDRRLFSRRGRLVQALKKII